MERRRDRGADDNYSMGIFHKLPSIGSAWAKDCVLYDLGVRDHDPMCVWYFNILYIQGQLNLLRIVQGMVVLWFIFFFVIQS